MLYICHVQQGSLFQITHIILPKEEIIDKTFLLMTMTESNIYPGSMNTARDINYQYLPSV